MPEIHVRLDEQRYKQFESINGSNDREKMEILTDAYFLKEPGSPENFEGEVIDHTKEAESYGSSDFGAFACQFRKPLNAEFHRCFSRNPLVRILHDGSVPQDICRLCERLQTEERFLNGPVFTKSGERYREHIINQREQRKQERLEHLQKQERIKTEGARERARIKAENSQRGKVNWGGSVSVDPFSY